MFNFYKVGWKEGGGGFLLFDGWMDGWMRGGMSTVGTVAKLGRG